MKYFRQSILLQGIAPDRIPQDVDAPLWDNGTNVLFKNGESVRTAGDKPTLPGASVSPPPRTAMFITYGVNKFWVYANENGIYAHDGAIEHDITPVSGWSGGATDLSITFTSCSLAGIAYFNRSDAAPVYWDGITSNPCQPIPDWQPGWLCIALRSHKSFLFAIGMTDVGGQRVRWSDAAEPGTVPQSWAPAADNLAGFVDVAPLDSNAVEGRSLRDSFLVYKTESIWSFDFVGGNEVFQARQLFREHGIAATHALTGGIDDVHVFAGDDGDIYMTDGVQVMSLLDGTAQRAFYADFSANTLRQFAAATVSREKIALIFYPGSGSDVPDRAMVIDLTTKNIAIRQAPDIFCAAQGAELQDVGGINSWEGDDQAWKDDISAWPQEVSSFTLDDVILGSASGFYMLGQLTGADPEGNEISARLERTGLSFGNPQRRKVIARFWPKIRGTPGDVVTVRLGGQEITGGAIQLAPPVDFVIGSNQHVDAFISGRYMSIEISSFGGSPWRLGSFDVEYREVGYF